MKILVVTGSVRPNSVNSVVVEAVKADLAAREGVEVSVADLGELNLPFFDAPTPPSAETYVVPHDNVERWGALVNDADGVVFVAAEYNHSLSAVQKNAIDWLYKEWNDKPVAFVGYGWYAGSHSLAQFKEIGIVTKWKLGETTTGLQFMKDLGVDGSFTDEAAVRGAIKATVDELVTSL
jgi:NAD(P)H-dependent FMN reductase